MQESDLKKKADSRYCENEVFFKKKKSAREGWGWVKIENRSIAILFNS